MDSTIGQYYLNVKKFEQNDFVDVCSTEEICEDKENTGTEILQHDILKSPNKRSWFF